jgi:hypothetical protein
MNKELLMAIYDEMKSLYSTDKTLTQIEVVFKIQPVKTEKRIGRITVKTYKDAN